MHPLALCRKYPGDTLRLLFIGCIYTHIILYQGRIQGSFEIRKSVSTVLARFSPISLFIENRRDYILPELSPKEGYTCITQTSSCLIYASRGFTQKLTVETIPDPQLHPKLQANEILLTPVVCIRSQEAMCSVNPAIVELMKTLEPSLQNPRCELVPLYSLSHPLEWKKLPSHGSKMLEDRVTFKITHFGYFAVIAQFSLPTATVIVEPSLSQPAQLVIPELPDFKLEVPPTSVRSKTNITATVHYRDNRSLYVSQTDHSPASAYVVLEPHNAQFEDQIRITMPIPNYGEIKRSHPNIKLELWNINEDTRGKLRIAEESSITIHQGGSGNYLATAHITHFSGYLYQWSTAIMDYFLSFFVQTIRGRCQVFMSHETKHASCTSFQIAVLLYPYQDPYSSLPNYPYILYDSVIPIPLVAGDIECQVELSELLLRSYPSSQNQKCHTKSCRLSKDFNVRVEFGILLESVTCGAGSEIPGGNLATLAIKQGESGIPPFILIKVHAQAIASKHYSLMLQYYYVYSLLITNLLILSRYR